MALLNSYSKANRVVMSDTVPAFSRHKIYGYWTWTNDLNLQFWITSAWEYRRFKSKSYKYVGMTYDAAKRCAEAAIEYYTRQTYVSEFQTTGDFRGHFLSQDGGKVLMADIVMNKVAGHMWEVVINVNEDDARISISSGNPKPMFATENQRKYDDGDTPFVDDEEEE